MVHITFYTTRILRRSGIRADFLANSTSRHWEECDYKSPSIRFPVLQALFEFIYFWVYIAPYNIVHLHFAQTMTRSGWELSVLKDLGRTIIIHFRGCDIRNYDMNVKLHPNFNICQNCDYDHSCIRKENQLRISNALQYC